MLSMDICLGCRTVYAVGGVGELGLGRRPVQEIIASFKFRPRIRGVAQ